VLHYEQLIALAKARGETLKEIVVFILQSSIVFNLESFLIDCFI
jgi:hypothetical protein